MTQVTVVKLLFVGIVFWALYRAVRYLGSDRHKSDPSQYEMGRGSPAIPEMFTPKPKQDRPFE